MAIKPFSGQVRFMAYLISLKFMYKNAVFSLLYIVQMGMNRQIDFPGGVSVYNRLRRKPGIPLWHALDRPVLCMGTYDVTGWQRNPACIFFTLSSDGYIQKKSDVFFWREVPDNCKNRKIIENDNESSRNNCLVAQKKLCDKEHMLSQLTPFSV